MAKIGFIGMGNMGYAILKGLLKSYKAPDIIFSDPNEERRDKIFEETGVEYVFSNTECASSAKYIILAIKPQFYDAVIANIRNVIKPDNVLISIAAGISIDLLHRKMGSDIRIVRAMPNTPALVNEGMTGVCYDDMVLNFEEKDEIKAIFGSVGKVKAVPEVQMDAVTCASGSSPAYVYMFIEALADSVVKYGMSRKDAYEFVTQTVSGAAKMVQQAKMHPGELKDMVCSPAGTTIEAVTALEEYGFRNAIIKATDACYHKSKKMKGKS